MPSAAFISRVTAEEQARLEEWRAAWAAYMGTTEPTLKTKAGQYDDNVQVNYARMIVDTSVHFLFGQEPEFEVGDSDTETSNPAEEWLDECWQANKKMQLLQKIGTNGGVCGHAFVKLQPPKAGEFPRIINISPEYVTVVTDPDDIDQVVRYIIQYSAVGRDGEELTIRQTVEKGETGRWTITDEISENGGRWQTVQAIEWPYDWCPIADCQNLPSPNEYYGISDIEADVLKLNRSINFVLSNLQRIIRFHAHPKPWGSGFSARELNVGPDQTIILPSGATLQNLEMQSDLASSIALYKELVQALHETSQTPEVASGKLESAGALSGVALSILYQPIVRKTSVKRLTYGDMLEELCRRLLDMGDKGYDQTVKIHWPEIMPRNRLEELQAAQIEESLGASQDTILQKLGYDPDEEKLKRESSGVDMAEQMLTAFDRGQ